MSFLIQQTLLYSVPLLIVALAGVFSERGGVVNLALEGTMIFGAFIGILFINISQLYGIFSKENSQLLLLFAMVVSAIFGAVFSLLLSFAAINLKANQTISGTALNLLSPALVLFLISVVSGGGALSMTEGDSASRFMLKRSDFGFSEAEVLNFFERTFLVKNYLTTYICLAVFIVLSVILYRTRFGLRLRSCGENPHAADALGISVKRMRYAGTTISGALSGMGGFVLILTTANATATGDVAGFGFLALAVMIFGNWNPISIMGAAFLFGLFKCIAASYATIDINRDGIYALAEFGISPNFYRMLPYLITLTVLVFSSKHSRAPKSEGIPYDKSKR